MTSIGKKKNTNPTSVFEVIKAQSYSQPDAIAILAPDKTPLTYAGLYNHIQYVVSYLNTSGIQRNDRVAIVLPNGPEMAVAFLAVASAATCAPLNPTYLPTEFEFYLKDLNAKAIMTITGTNSAAIEAAKALKLKILELKTEPDNQAGIFTISGDDNRNQIALEPIISQPDDVALVLHTSGTTSRPKIVPLTHANICTSSQNIKKSFELTPRDRCLNVMPLFHIHGLIGATLSTMAAGASIVCTPGFSDSQFFNWLEEFSPTWYTAVPTMHQAIYSHAETNREIIENNHLRFIRSCSSALPPNVMNQVEEVFKVPFVESYGMTEASHQMSSNPLPPLKRKAGSVGLETGVEISIMDEIGNLLKPGTIGEIVIRGPNVTHGYVNNPTANENSFIKGWFRTGDQGYLDSDGYLFITGRIKEIINRGGEKIAPREIEEALLNHPAIRQAVAFSIPHPTLGEDVAAAVVLQEDIYPTESEIRHFARSHLAGFKVPSRIVVLDEIPKGPTGKLQRIGLADKLAHKLNVAFVPARNPIEEKLAHIWAEVLNLERVGVDNNFSNLGGDSLFATVLFSKVIETFKIETSLEEFYKRATIAEQATFISSLLDI